MITVLRNQEQRIFDWIDYHIKVGFDTFIIYDDNSTDNSVNEVHLAREKFPNINIFVSSTDGVGGYGIGGPYSYVNNHQGVDDRRNRYFTEANNYVKNINPEAICAALDVDEFLASDYNLKDSLKQLFAQGHKQILVMNVDIKHDYDLKKGFIQNNNFMRWNYTDIENHEIWKTRTKSIFISKYLNQFEWVHNPMRETYVCKDYELLRFYHFRIPNLPWAESINFVPDNYFDKFK